MVGGEVKPTSMFGEDDEDETDPQVLYDKVSLTSLWPFTVLLYNMVLK